MCTHGAAPCAWSVRPAAREPVSLTENLGHAYVRDSGDSDFWRMFSTEDIRHSHTCACWSGPRTVAPCELTAYWVASPGRFSESPTALLRSECAMCFTYTPRHSISYSGIAAGSLCSVHTAWSTAHSHVAVCKAPGALRAGATGAVKSSRQRQAGEGTRIRHTYGRL